MGEPHGDPCAPRDQAVCKARRQLARACLVRLAAVVAEVDPRVQTITMTSASGIWGRDDGPEIFQLWYLHDLEGRRIHDFSSLYGRIGPLWKSVERYANELAMLANDRRHPPGFYYVHPLVDERDRAILLPRNPRGPAPRTVGELQ
ncbi:hypothetical protein [Streptomyces spiramyceticus]|uniref:hypothetical protein n=1 Tax=Streptomyces spiramyceticus TaxID=299717 RepID=UPI00237B5125|nr:hypothetical protein [Streptomyces spiramyceticus]